MLKSSPFVGHCNLTSYQLGGGNDAADNGSLILGSYYVLRALYLIFSQMP